MLCPLPVTLWKHVSCIFPEKSSNPMMAYITITNITSRAMCNKGTIALMIAFKTTWREGTPDTNRRGRKTRNALSALTSNPSFMTVERAVERSPITTMMKSSMFQTLLR